MSCGEGLRRHLFTFLLLQVSSHPAGRCSVGDWHSEVRCHQSRCGNASRLQQAGCPMRLSLCSRPPVTSRSSEQACLCAHNCACFHTSHLVEAFTPHTSLKLHPPPCGLPRPRHGFSQSSLAVLISGVCGTLPKIYSSLARGEVAFCPFSKVVSVLKTKAKNQKTSQTPPCHLCPWLLGPRPFSPSCPAPPRVPGMGRGALSPGGGTPPALSLLHPERSDTCLEEAEAPSELPRAEAALAAPHWL